MVYVTWKDDEDDDVNIVDFDTVEEAEEFVKDNNLSDIAEITGMEW